MHYYNIDVTYLWLFLHLNHSVNEGAVRSTLIAGETVIHIFDDNFAFAIFKCRLGMEARRLNIRDHCELGLSVISNSIFTI